MIGKLLATTALLAGLTTGATIGLEAVGLLFRADAPQQRVSSIRTEVAPLQDPEAMLLRPLEALDRARTGRRPEAEEARPEAAGPYDAVEEAVEEERYLADALRWAERYRQRREAEQRLAAREQPKAAGHDLPKAGGDAETTPAGVRPLAQRSASKLQTPNARGLTPAAAGEAVDEERYLADALRWAERYRRQQEEQKRVAVPEPPQLVAEGSIPVAAADAEWKGPPRDAWAPTVVATVAGSTEVRIAEVRPPQSAPPRGAPEPAHRPRAQPRRERANRASAGRGDSYRCPFLGWLLPAGR